MGKLDHINAKKIFYNEIPAVEFDYLLGIKNHVEENEGCAIKTRKGLLIMGRVIEISNNYMVINTIEIGKVTVDYSIIVGMFPCVFPDDYGV